MNTLIYQIENIVRESGKILLDVDRDKIEVESKDGIGNIVTFYDKDIQNYLKRNLLSLLPNASFIGEEGDNNKINEGYTFIVDPIDGTTNFYRDLSLSVISVALFFNGKPYMGVCYNPYLNEMFIAERGKGSYLNGKKINVSNKKLNEGLVVAGSSPYYMELKNKSLNILNKFFIIANDYRRSGSAALDLCNIACGRYEVFFELKLQPWDYAAGILIVEEAGGKVTNIDGNNVTFSEASSILASNNVEDYLKYIKVG